MVKRKEKVEEPLQKAIDQLTMAMRTMYNAPKEALRLMGRAEDNIAVAHIALYMSIGGKVKR